MAVLARFIVLLIILTSLHADETPNVLSSTEGEPGLLVGDCVDPYSGTFYRRVEDLRIEGFVPIVIERVNGEFLPHLSLECHFERREDRNGEIYYQPYVAVPERSGGRIWFTRIENSDWQIAFDRHPGGFTNSARGLLNSRTNLKNHRLEEKKHCYRLKTCDGGERIYGGHSHTLREERLPNGCWYLYSYDKKDRLIEIRSTNPSKNTVFAWARFHYEHGKDCIVEASDGRRLHYVYWQKGPGHDHYLVEINSPERPIEQLSYDVTKKHEIQLSRLYHPSGKWISLKHRSRRIDTLEFPDGQHFRLSYYPKTTTVCDGKKHLLYYNYDDTGKLSWIDKKEYLNGTHSPYAKWVYVYGSGQPHGDHELLSRTRESRYANTNCKTEFLYDAVGNVIEERLCGNLTGRSLDESYKQRFAYSKEGFVTRSEQENGLAIAYEYLSGTSLLTKKCTWDHATLIRRECFFYDEDHILVCRTEDDGDNGSYQRTVRITPRKEMPACGLPEQIEEFAGGQLLKRLRIHYDAHGYVCGKEIFDAEGQLCYDCQYRRDDKGRVIEEKDPLARIRFIAYNADGLKVRETSFGGSKTTHYSYDSRGNLIAQTEETSEGVHQTTRHHYDLLDHLIKTIDYLGHETSYEVDCNGYPLETVLADGSAIQKTFDAWGHELTKCDPEGHVTTTDYNARGQPIKVMHPDGTSEHRRYHCDGTLKESIDREGNTHFFEYDAQGRRVLHRFLDKQETHVYDHFFLRQIIDAAGNIIHYFYDAAGRKIREVGMQDISYSYDHLGRLAKKTNCESSNLYVYDALDRLIEEKEETLDGSLISHRKIIYNNEGQIAENWVYDGKWIVESAFVYDGFGRIVKSTDACGRVSHLEYDDCRVITTDPKGLKTIETKDPLGHTSRIEKIGIGYTKLSQVDYTYTAGGLLAYEAIKRTDKTLITKRDWDCMGRLVCLTEAAGTEIQRKTFYGYTRRGGLATIRKPDGVVISMDYDPYERCTRKHASDDTIDYLYSYNALDEVTVVEDRTLGLTSIRTYDNWGRLIKDRLATGIGLKFSYDTFGRRSSLILPDSSTINYTYEKSYLCAISRKDYSHRYTAYDPCKRVLAQEFSADAGREELAYDNSGRLMARSSPYSSQKILNQDSAGNILEILDDHRLKHYQYDDLEHVIEEPEHAYVFDNLHNRLKKNHLTFSFDELNQHTAEFTYDTNGNPLSMGEIRLTYDALGRLIGAELPSIWKASYAYDAWHRRIHSVVSTENGEQQQYYLWDHDCEIGSCDPKGKIQELRVIGATGSSEQNRTLAIELNGHLYIPIHDLFGNIRCLVDRAGKISESYSYTIFGESSDHSRINNPWRYAGKRVDHLTGLIYYGKRYYSPKYSRFLTPDPRGLAAGPNLYAFNLGNPLRYYDAFGEWEKENVFENLEIGRHVGTWEGSGLETLSFAIHEGIHALGSLVTSVGLYLVPDFLGGGLLRTAGDYMQIACEPGLLDHYPHLKNATVEGDGGSRIFTVGNRHASDLVRISLGNGVCTRRADIHKFAREVSKLHNNAIIKVCYNTTHGLFADLIDSLLEKGNFQTHPVKLLMKAWRQCIDDMGGTDGGGKIIHYAHSEGGIITACALKALIKEERKMLEVYTFGSASLFDRKLARFVQHYVAAGDPIPLTDPIGYGKALFANDGSVEFIGNSLNTFLQHSIMGNAYWQIFTDLSLAFNKNYGYPP